MKKVKALLALLLLVASVAFAAVTQSNGVGTNVSTYVVQKGDTLWDLARVKRDNPWAWKQVLDENPVLKKPGRVFEKDGKTIVLIKPGEKLFGLEKYGFLPMPIPSQPSGGTLTYTLLRDLPVEEPEMSWWVPFLGVLLVLLALYALFLLSTRKDAATNGPAMVKGGVNDVTARDRFQAMASEQFGRRTGQSFPVQSFQILKQQRGRASGMVNVRYADGSEAARMLNDQVAYKAQVRFPDESEGTLYMLAACGNDLRYGGIARYIPGPKFHFIPDAVTETAAEPAAQTVAPAPASSSSRLAPLPADVAFEFKPARDDKPPLIRFRNNMQVEAGTDGTITLRLA
jgi:hypothetical protein